MPKATTKQERVKTVLDSAREVKKRRDLSSEAVRDELNKDYLSEEDKVTVHTVTKWMNPNVTAPNGESILALQEWVNANQTQTS